MSIPERKPVRIAHLTTVHPRHDPRIFHKECASLASAGNEVFLLVADGGGDERLKDVQLLDIGAQRSRLLRILFQPWRMFRAARRLRAAVYHIHDPEMLPAATLLRWLGARIVYDAHEDLPRQVLTKDWVPKRLRGLTSWIVERIENFFARQLNGIVAATPAIAERFRRINPVVIEVRNYPILTDIAFSSGPRSRTSRVVCYVGGIAEARGVVQMLDALEFVPDIRFVLCGAMDNPEFESRLRNHKSWAKVDYRGVVDRAGVSRAFEESALGMVTLLPYPSYKESLPVKMFEYMAAELPVIASDFAFWREIVQPSGCGICVDPERPELIAAAIREILDDPARAAAMGASGRAAVVREYNWDQQAKNLLTIYQQILSAA
jgi:glycosyltransferase involved in cell wall biosynthesis